MSSLVKEFNDYRSRMNKVILSKNNLVMKRLWNLDTNTYENGALDTKTKEMLGLVASMVLRCDDCIKYHLGKCHELGITTAQIVRDLCCSEHRWRYDCNPAYPSCGRVLGRIRK
jgi:AhpD family alkylhydroperoxidase